MRIPIDPNRKYSPKDIVTNKFILNQEGNPDYRYTLRLIAAGRLRAKNVAIGGRKYYQVLGSDIITWKNSTYNIERQPEVYILGKNEKRPYPQPYDAQT